MKPTEGVALLRPTDVAKQLNVSRSWVYAAVADGRLPHVKLPGGLLRFHPDEINKLVTGVNG